MARKNPDMTTWLLIAAAGVGIYMVARGQKTLAGATMVRTPGGPRFVKQFYGSGPSRDFACYDTVDSEYVDDEVCKGYDEPEDDDKQLEGWW